MARTIGGIKIPDKDTYKVISTFDYKRFRWINGNREVDHADKIEKSIKECGLLLQPVLVNEKMEIIEGQNRFEACRNLGLPIYYVVQEGLGMTAVQNLNAVSKNWNTYNYIHSYAAGDGNVDYVYIEQLIKAYNWATLKHISYAITGKVGHSFKEMKEGTFACTTAQYNKAVMVLDYTSQFVEWISGASGRKEYCLIAIMFCYRCPVVDNDYLLKKFQKYGRSLESIGSITEAVKQIEEKVYNWQMRSPREPVSISMEYERALRSSRYEKKE